MSEKELDIVTDRILRRDRSPLAPGKRRYAASYERKSDQDSYGIDSQYHANRDQAALEGYEIPNDPRFRYSDDDTSGVLRCRAGFNRLLQVLRDGDAPFDRVYAKDRSRFGRFDDPRQHHYYEVLFKEYGVLLRYSNDPDVELSSTSGSEALGHFLKGFIENITASEERKTLIRRTRGGLRRRVLDGFYPGPVAPYGAVRWAARQDTGELLEPVVEGAGVRHKGYNYRLLWADDGTTEIVREIFERYEAGETMAAIARSLQERGVRSPHDARGRGGRQKDGQVRTFPWTDRTIRHILRNAIYVGDLYWGRDTSSKDPLPAAQSRSEDTTPIYVRDFMPSALVSRERFAAVQRRIELSVEETSLRRASKPEFPLSGLLRCMHCGGYISGFQPPNAKHRYYRHQPLRARRGVMPEPCPHQQRYLRTERIEPAMEQVVATLLSEDSLNALALEELDRRLDDQTTQRRIQELARLRRDHAATEANAIKAAANEASATTERQRAIYAAAVSRMVEELMSLERRIADLEAETQAVEQARELVQRNLVRQLRLTEEFASAEPEVRKRAMRMLVEVIRVDFDADDVEVRVRAA